MSTRKGALFNAERIFVVWETIGNVLTSENALIVLCFLLFMVIMAVILIRAGVINVHTDSVSIGAADKERQIIRVQLEWIMTHLKGIEASIDKPEGYNEYLGQCVIEALYDQYVDRITQNHITNSTEYVEIVQTNVIAIVDSLTVNPDYKTDEFKEMLKEDTKFCINKLIQIRKVYK